MHRQYFQAPGGNRLRSARIPNSGLTPTKSGSNHLRRPTPITLVVAVLLGLLALSGCVVSEHTHGEHGAEGAGHEHADSGEGHGEESGNLLTLEETYDVVRLGARLILEYSAEDNAFVGTVQNTTDETLPQVRVEVHLSNGVELGPTTPQDLESGETVEVVLSAVDQEFDGWSPHAEVGGSEHGHEGEGGSEHGSG